MKSATRSLRGLLLAASVLCPAAAHAEDGYDLWLRYRPVEKEWIAPYRAVAADIVVAGASPTVAAARDELERGLTGMLGRAVPETDTVRHDGDILIGTPETSPTITGLNLPLGSLGREGYLIRSVSARGHRITVIAANSDIGVLYGAFNFLKLMQTRQLVDHIDIASAPKLELRVLDHWDNLDETVTRGYAGSSIWNWQKLPDYLDPRTTDYARADASVGINGAVLNGVNSQAEALTPLYIAKEAALADALRPYGIKVYLSARFSAPIDVGGLKTADPLDPQVQAWWKAKTDEIYRAIPDFGGFLVKANSEGTSGPQDYGRTHADGANMLADALAPHHGIVMWRAFVYANGDKEDRIKQAYDEFVPLDGKFRDTVLLQVKNGPLDFQPREPFSPLFGATPRTQLMLEVQITKEYLGFSTHLVYLAPLYSEALMSDTYARGPGSTVAKVIDGSLFGAKHTGMSGVSNIGSDRDWTGSEFDQANWYAFGRLAWDPQASPRAIAEDWARMTFSNDKDFVGPVAGMMMASREAVVDYMTPLGLAHLMGTDHHYGPAPWVDNTKRHEWNPVYYHRADANGIGFDRTETGSNAIAQYAPPLREQFSKVGTTPEKFLLWFHHVDWDHRMASGRTLWEEIVYRYSRGVDEVRQMRETWARMKPFVDKQRFDEEAAFLAIQEKEATWWRDACLAYFSSVSGRPIPPGYAQPAHSLDYYKSLTFPYPPGIDRGP
jgi:alpha-glucuronidase